MGNTTPTFTMRLGQAERNSMTRLVTAARLAGRSGFTDSDAVRAALRFAAATTNVALVLSHLA